MQEVIGLFCLLVLLRRLVSKHLIDASISESEPLVKLRGSGQGDSFAIDWWAAVNTYIHNPAAAARCAAAPEPRQR